MSNRFDHSGIRLSLMGLALASGVIATAFAHAEPINVTAERGVIVGDLVHGDDSTTSSSLGTFDEGVTQALGGTHTGPYGPFTTSEITTAEQDSSIDPSLGLFSGTGSVGIGFSVVDADLVFAKSSFDVSFDLLSDHSYTLTGKLGASMDGGQGVALFELDGPNSLNSLSFEKVNSGNLILDSGGILSAGHYHLSISASVNPTCQPWTTGDCSASSYMGGSSFFNANFQVAAVTAPIPEPETYAMLLAGLSVLGFMARRRNKEST